MSALDTSDVASLRRLNAQTTLDCLRREPERWFSVRELAELTDLSRPTVSRVLDDLVKASQVMSEAGLPGGTGRPARKFHFNGRAGLIASVDTGINVFHVSVTDLAGAVLAQITRRVGAIDTEAEFGATVAHAVNEAVQEAACPVPVRGIAIAVPATLDKNGALYFSQTAKHWEGFHPVTAVQEHFPQAVVVAGRDIEYSMLAEMTSGALQGVNTGVYVLAQATPHVALVLNGEVMRGAHGLAAARPRHHGTSEDADWTNLRAQMFSGLEHQKLSQVMLEAEQGSRRALDSLEKFAQGLIPRLTFLIRALSPECVVVGGVMADRPEIILPAVQKAALDASGLDPASAPDSGRLTEVVLSMLDPTFAATLGGVHAALSSLDWSV